MKKTSQVSGIMGPQEKMTGTIADAARQKWFHSLQWRLLALMLGLAACYAFGIFYIRHWHKVEVSKTLQQQVRRDREFFSNLVELRERALYTYAYDYTYWDEMVTFVEEHDSAWGEENINQSLGTYDASMVWVYDPEFEPVYFTSSDGDSSLQDLSVLRESYTALFAHSPFAHFFVPTPHGLLEVRGATIHPTADDDRVSPTMGYFFAGRLWDDSYLSELGRLAKGDVTVSPPPIDALASDEAYDENGNVSWTYPLTGWDGRPVAALSVRMFSQEIQQQITTTNLVHVLSALLTLGLLAIVSWVLARWVSWPLRQISCSLAAENAGPIESLRGNSTELGHIAGLIRRFLKQKAELVHEIEQRRRAEHDLWLTKFSVDHAAMAVFWINPAGRFVYVNTAACQALEYTEAELLKLAVPDIDAGVTEPQWHAQWEQLKARRSFTLEAEHCGKSGERFPVELTVNYLRFDGEEYGCAFALDISERKQAEREREKLETQLRRAQRLETIGTLAGGVAHDFNNILTPILGYADMSISRLEAKHPIRKDIEQIARSAMRAKDLVRQILAFSRQGEQERRPVQLHTVFGEVLQLLRASLPTTIEIRGHLNRDCGTVRCDPSQMHQVLMNLCTNAFQAMDERGGVIEITLDDVDVDAEFSCLHLNLNEGPYARLTVSDTGCGMDRATTERIFEPFFTTRPTGKGTGLGLSVAHGIVMAHGGGVTVYSEVGRGTTFHVYLPISACEDDHLCERTPTEMIRGTERVLLVDDERDVAAMGKEMLERLGYAVTTRSSSLDAAALFRANPGLTC